jgi:predicted aconitase with swiveling domain
VKGRVLAAGQADAAALVLDEPLSLWGGVDPGTGLIIDARHPQLGASVSGRVLVLPAARGSSSSSSVLAELVRAERAPAAILVGELDLILAVGAAVAEELYGRRVPVLVIPTAELAALRDGQRIIVSEDGSVTAG